MAAHSQVNTLFKHMVPVEIEKKKKRKANIPVALREAVWITRFGRVFAHKCSTSWCPNTITVFDFQSGHNVPESKGGPTTINNLFPLCARCNLSMGDRYTLDEWSTLGSPPPEPKPVSRYLCFLKCLPWRPATVASTRPSP
jgi:5-methylcytosine-specific restriction endonuclease McrA